MNKLIIMCGVSGSGKSTYAKKLCEENAAKGEKYAYISRDEIRRRFLEGEENVKDMFMYEDKVYYHFVLSIAARLRRENVVADATFLTPKARLKLLNALKKYIDLSKVQVECIVVETEEETCRERNMKREKSIRTPKEVITNMAKVFRHPKETEYNYNKITKIKGE